MENHNLFINLADSEKEYYLRLLKAYAKYNGKRMNGKWAEGIKKNYSLCTMHRVTILRGMSID